MKIIKGCKTCEFNLNNVCESHHSENGYKWCIDDFEKERRCWAISSKYSQMLFDSLSDEDKIVCELYDVIKEKNMYGKKVLGIERSTFIINEEGYLIKDFRKVKVKGHIDAVLEELK